MHPTKPSLLIDVDFYDDVIDDPDISPDQKRQLIEIIGQIVVAFIDIGFGVHPVQLAQAESVRSAAQNWADDHMTLVQPPEEKERLPERTSP